MILVWENLEQNLEFQFLTILQFWAVNNSKNTKSNWRLLELPNFKSINNQEFIKIIFYFGNLPFVKKKIFIYDLWGIVL